MRMKNKRPIRRKIVLRLPDLDHAKSAVLSSLSSPCSRRNYTFSMEQFITWYCSELRLTLNRTVVLRFRLYQESLGLAAGTCSCSRFSPLTRSPLQFSTEYPPANFRYKISFRPRMQACKFMKKHGWVGGCRTACVLLRVFGAKVNPP
jgi:hypothetical protein